MPYQCIDELILGNSTRSGRHFTPSDDSLPPARTDVAETQVPRMGHQTHPHAIWDHYRGPKWLAGCVYARSVAGCKLPPLSTGPRPDTKQYREYDSP